MVMSKSYLSPVCSLDSFHIPFIAYIDRGNQKLCFYSGRIRTLVAMATYSSHRLIMGKVEICKKNSVSMEIFGIFLQKCLLSTPLCFI